MTRNRTTNSSSAIANNSATPPKPRAMVAGQWLIRVAAVATVVLLLCAAVLRLQLPRARARGATDTIAKAPTRLAGTAELNSVARLRGDVCRNGSFDCGLYFHWHRIPQTGDSALLEQLQSSICPEHVGSACFHEVPADESPNKFAARLGKRPAVVTESTHSILTEHGDDLRAVRAVVLRDPILRFLDEVVGTHGSEEGSVLQALPDYTWETTMQLAEHLGPAECNKQTQALLGPGHYAQLGLSGATQQLDGDQLTALRESVEGVHLLGLYEMGHVTQCLWAKTLEQDGEMEPRFCGEMIFGPVPDIVENDSNAPTTETTDTTASFPLRVYVHAARLNMVDEVLYGLTRRVFFDRMSKLEASHPLWEYQAESAQWSLPDPVLRAQLQKMDEIVYLPEVNEPSSNERTKHTLEIAPLSAIREFRACRYCRKPYPYFQSYVHVHKNAGQTMTSILEAEICPEYPNKVERRKTCVAFYATGAANIPVRAGEFRLHHSEREAADLQGPNVLKEVFLRSPLVRTISSYEYDIWHSKFDPQPLDEAIKDVHFFPKKHGSRQISHVSPRAECSEALKGTEESIDPKLVQHVADSLRMYHVVGLVEHFRLSVCVWAYTLMSKEVEDRHCGSIPLDQRGAARNAKKSEKESYQRRTYAMLAHFGAADEYAYRIGRFEFIQRLASIGKNTSLWDAEPRSV